MDLFEMWKSAGDLLHLPSEVIMIGMVALARREIAALAGRVLALEFATGLRKVVPAGA